MTVELLERDSGQREVLVDSLDDLLLVRDGLLTLREQSTDLANTDHIQALRDEVVDDITETMAGAIKEERYTFNEADAALIGTAKAVALKARESEILAQKPVPIIPSYPHGSSRQIVQPKITSFFDPRLDDKPRRWFSR